MEEKEKNLGGHGYESYVCAIIWNGKDYSFREEMPWLLSNHEEVHLYLHHIIVQDPERSLSHAPFW